MMNLNTMNQNIKFTNFKKEIIMDKMLLTEEEYILQDKEYFKKIITKMIVALNGSKKEIHGSSHTAKHPNGMVNIAKYNAKTNTIIQYNNVSQNNPKGTSIIKYTLD